MAYNNYFPATYGGYSPNPYSGMQTYPQTVQPAQNNGIQWVQGEAGAKAFNVGAGQSVLLMDSESNAFYIKATDQSGMPLPLRVFDYTERTAQSVPTVPQSAPIDTSLYVTHEELEQRLAALTAPTVAKKTTTKKQTEGE